MELLTPWVFTDDSHKMCMNTAVSLSFSWSVVGIHLGSVCIPKHVSHKLFVSGLRVAQYHTICSVVLLLFDSPQTKTKGKCYSAHMLSIVTYKCDRVQSYNRAEQLKHVAKEPTSPGIWPNNLLATEPI